MLKHLGQKEPVILVGREHAAQQVRYVYPKPGLEPLGEGANPVQRLAQQLSGQKKIQDTTKRVHVKLLTNRKTIRLWRELQGAHRILNVSHALLGQHILVLLLRPKLRRAKVNHIRLAGLCDQNIIGLQVQVEYILLVHLFDDFANFEEDTQYFI